MSLFQQAPRGQPLSKEIRQQRTGGDIARFEPDFHRVKTVTDFSARAVEKFQVAAGGVTKGVLLAGIDGLRGTAKGLARAGADLDKNQDIAVAAHQVDLAIDHFVIAGQHLVTVAAQEAGRDAFTIIPDLSRRRQPRRRNALVSA